MLCLGDKELRNKLLHNNPIKSGTLTKPHQYLQRDSQQEQTYQ